MRKRKFEQPQEAPFSMTPMIDIIFLLLIFFLLLPVKSIEGVLKNDLPNTGNPNKTTPLIEQKEKVKIVIRRSGPLDINASQGIRVDFMGRQYRSLNSVQHKLDQLSVKYRDNLSVELFCGNDVPFKFVMDFLSGCSRSQIKDVRFSRVSVE